MRRSNFIHKLAVTFLFVLRSGQHFSVFLPYLGVLLCVVEVGQLEGHFLGLDGLFVSSVADECSKADNDSSGEDEKD